MQSIVFLRSPYAHAKITKLDTTAAEQHPGVLKVYTGKDFASVPVPCGVTLPNSGQIYADLSCDGRSMWCATPARSSRR